MVDGVIGYLDHAVKHVVEEYEVSLESVTILNLPAMVNNVKAIAIILSQGNAMTSVVLVRACIEYCGTHTYVYHRDKELCT